MKAFFLQGGWVDVMGKAWPLAPYFIVPVLIAKLICRGSWMQILQAYGIWLTILAVVSLTGASRFDEGVGWSLIIALFTTVFAIPIFVLSLKFFQR